MDKKKNIILISIIVIVAISIIVVCVIISKNVNKNKQQEEVFNNLSQVTVENTTESKVVEIKEDNNDDAKDYEVNNTIEKGKIAESRSIYIDQNGEKAVIPEGFGIVNDSTNLKDGLVISDVLDDDLNNSKGGNQFVWIPVKMPVIDASECTSDKEINDLLHRATLENKYPMSLKLSNGNYKSVLYNFKTRNLGSDIEISSIEYKSSSTELCEPTNLKNIDSVNKISEWTEDLYQNEYNETIKKIKIDRGFWIARFETSMNSNNIAQSKKNARVTSNINWFEFYKTEKTLNVATTKSHMIWGAQWDQTMIWLQDIINNSGTSNRYYLIDSTNMGNYMETKIEDNATNTVLKESGSAVKAKSGEWEVGRVKNIYDLAGNVFEWTMESNYETVRTVRGGYAAYDAVTYPVSSRYATATTEYTNIVFGSRMILY